MTPVDRAVERVPWWANIWPLNIAYERGLSDGMSIATDIIEQAVS